MNRDLALKRLRDFVDQQRGADDLADRGSLDRAADVMALYDDKQWVDELPAPKTVRHRGRPVDPQSFSRFSKWLTQQVGLTGAHAYRLRDAHQLQANYLSRGEIKPRGEHQLRPLKWLTKHEYADRVPEVWELACELANGKAPDNPTVRRALSKWKHDNVPKAEMKSGPRGGQALVDRWLSMAHRIMEEYPERFVEAINLIEADAETYFAAPENTREHAAA